MEFEVRNSAVLVTGAAMGMGRLFALRAAREGARAVVLWDIDAAGLEKVAEEIRALDVRVIPMTLDVADLGAVAVAAGQVIADLGTLEVLINNAGVVRGKPFWEHDVHRDIKFTLDINTLAPMVITRHFITGMMTADGRQRRILNIASAAATVSNPRMSVYAASKWAVLGWSDSLRLELEQTGIKSLKVTTFCPTYIGTGMFAGARGPLLTPIIAPDAAVDAAWRAMAAGTPIKYMPWTTTLGTVLKGLLPLGAWDFVAGRVFGVYRSMDHFTGRDAAASELKPERVDDARG